MLSNISLATELIWQQISRTSSLVKWSKDLPFGSIRLKEKGSSGGHNGLKNIENQLHTIEYKRLKLGISNNKEIDTKDYVLGKFSQNEKRKLPSQKM